MGVPEQIPDDPRSAGELASDWADQMMVDFFRASGLLEHGEFPAWSHENLLIFCRAAWAAGAAFGAANPEEVKEWMSAFEEARRKLPHGQSPPSSSQSID